MGAKNFSNTQRSTMCGLKKLASGVFPESWKVLAERRRRHRTRKRTKNNKSPGYPEWLNKTLFSSDKGLASGRRQAILKILHSQCHVCWWSGAASSQCLTLQWRHNERDGVSNPQPHDCFFDRLFKVQIKENIKVTGEFPAQMANNAENVSIWWRHHDQIRWYSYLPRIYSIRVTSLYKRITRYILGNITKWTTITLRNNANIGLMIVSLWSIIVCKHTNMLAWYL